MPPCSSRDSPAAVSALRVLVVSGIWPPDVGGPASHGPQVAAHLLRAGHRVSALVSAEGQLADPGFPVRVTPRRGPLPVRMARGAAALVAATRSADVVYATGIYHRAALSCRAAGVPLVIKLVNDPAYERARNRGWFDGTLEQFQRPEVGRDPRLRLLRRMRDIALGQAAQIIVPSAYLAQIAASWRLRVPLTVIHNPAVGARVTEAREVLRRDLGLTGPSVVFAGRFVPQKNLPLLVSAMAGVAGLTAHLVGDGPERHTLEAAIASSGVGERVRLVPPVPQSEVGRWMAAADATVLPSDWENFPHAAVESLAQGTPVIATAVGGVPEIVEHDRNGWLLEAGDRASLERALQRVAGDAGALDHLRAGAEADVRRFDPEPLFEAARLLLEAAARRQVPSSTSSSSVSR